MVAVSAASSGCAWHPSSPGGYDEAGTRSYSSPGFGVSRVGLPHSKLIHPPGKLAGVSKRDTSLKQEDAGRYTTGLHALAFHKSVRDGARTPPHCPRFLASPAAPLATLA